jgi:hypothetical protein
MPSEHAQATDVPTPAQLREHLADARASTFRVLDGLHLRDPARHARCRLAARELTAALLVIDAVVSELE